MLVLMVYAAQVGRCYSVLPDGPEGAAPGCATLSPPVSAPARGRSPPRVSEAKEEESPFDH